MIFTHNTLNFLFFLFEKGYWLCYSMVVGVVEGVCVCSDQSGHQTPLIVSTLRAFRWISEGGCSNDCKQEMVWDQSSGE